MGYAGKYCNENLLSATLTRPSPPSAHAAFDNANALTYSEINILLKKYVENKRLLDSNFQPNPMMKLAQEYAERFATTTNSDVAQQIRKCAIRSLTGTVLRWQGTSPVCSPGASKNATVLVCCTSCMQAAD